MDISNDVGALEGIERGEPSSGVIFTLGLVEVVGDGDQLRSNKVVGELFTEIGRPIPGPADPGFLQRNYMVLEIL